MIEFLQANPMILVIAGIVVMFFGGNWQKVFAWIKNLISGFRDGIQVEPGEITQAEAVEHYNALRSYFEPCQKACEDLQKCWCHLEPGAVPCDEEDAS